ncbi:MAG: 3-dehydroquinate synthase [Bacteroidota bacterium]|jgi:3-dehydroquinate synthase|nr:3-dehydroquinate synthase [Bacteroidota bacterium]HHU97094.1 3-dehydroquinate synthase [Petrimonas sp.]
MNRITQRVIKSGRLASDLQEIIEPIRPDKCFILVDEQTLIHCFPLLQGIPATRDATTIVIPPGDSNKTLDSLSRVWEQLTENGATRHSLLINLGGGMVSDLGGFAAATFKRGIRYINIPTTLLGAVDAAVGGKTGINFQGYKNEVGAFYPPYAVLLSPVFFRSLDRPAILSGYAEMVKHALLHSTEEWDRLLTFPLQQIDYPSLNELLFRSVAIKQAIVEKDPYEKNLRKALNLGHTAGHAFESFALGCGKPVPHGYAVAWGLVVALWLSYRLHGFPEEKLRKTVRFIQQHYGPFPITCGDYDALHEIAMHDKKNVGEAMRFTLLKDIGNVLIDQAVEKNTLFDAFDFFVELFTSC